MKPTVQQEAFLSAMEGSSNIALSAVAGSGKTTTLTLGSQALSASGRHLAVAFNKRIVEDMVKKFPSTIVCKTMNALGHQSWGKQLGKRLTLNTEKIPVLIKAEIPDFNSRMRTPKLEAVIRSARLNNLDPQSEQEEWEEILEGVDPDTDEGPLYISRARKILEISNNDAYRGTIDFTDQLYCPVQFDGPFEKYDTVLVDESQDLSPLQHAMISRCIKDRVIIAGDPRQAIYGFAGAMPGSMESFQRRFGMEELPLTWSFRCPKAIVREAQHFNPVIESAPWAVEGEVTRRGFEAIQRGDVVISYRNSKLISAAFAIIRSGIGAKMVGAGDLASQLVKLAGKFPFESTSKYIERVQAWKEREMSMLLAAKKKGPAERLAERAECLIQIVLGSEAKSIPEIELRIRDIFDMDGKDSNVLCSTIHKAKGLEWPRVHFLHLSDLFRGRDLSEAEREQRRNMAYVGITRSQQYLNFIQEKSDGETQ